MNMKNEKNNGVYHQSKRVLCFSSAYRLDSVHRSARSIATSIEVSTQAISMACNGKRIAVKGCYYRYLQPGINVDFDSKDAILNLKEYDKICNIQREYYTIREMAKRKRAAKERRSAKRKGTQ